MAQDFGKQVGKLSIKVLPNASKFYNAVRDMVKEAEAKYQVNLDVLAETKRAREELEKLYQEWDGKNVALEAQVTTAKAKAELLALTRPRKVTVIANVRQKSFDAALGFLSRITGARVARSVFTDISEQIVNLDQNVGKISRVSLVVAQLTSSLLALSAGTIAVSGDLLKMVNLALVGPAAFGSLAVGVGTLVVALKDASTQLAELGPAFTGLADIIKGNFWEQARQPLIDFVTKYLPQLEAGFGDTAAALGRQAAAFTNAFSDAMGGGVMETLFANLVATMDEVTKGMAPIVSAFVTLGEVGSAYLPEFGKWLTELATKFNTWVQNGKQSGEIAYLIEQGVQAAQDFGRAIGGVTSILSGLYNASKAGGAGGLGGLADSLQAAAAIINGPDVQVALSTLFRGAGYATDSLGAGFADIAKMLGSNASAIAGALGQAGATLGSFFSAIAKALDNPLIRGGLTDLFAGIDRGAKGLEPALKPAADVIGMLMSIVGEAAAQFGTLVGAIKVTLAPVLESLLGVVAPLIPIFGEALTGAVRGLQPFFQGLGDTITAMQPVLTPLIAGFAGLVVAIVGVQKAIAIGKAAWSGYRAVMDGIDTARIVAMYAGDWVKNIASSTKTLAVNSAAWVKNAAAVTAAKAKAAGSWVASQVSALAQSTAALAKNGAAWTANAAKAGAAKASAAGAWLAEQAKAIALSTAALVKQGAAWVATAAKAVAYKVAQVAISVATKAAAAAQWVLNAAMSANPIGLIIAAIAAVVAALVWFFTQTEVGKNLWAGFVGFLTDAWNNIVSVASTVFTALGDFFSGLWTGIVTTAQNIWNGITSFFTGLWNTLVGFFQTWGPVILAVIAPFIGIPLLIATHWTEFVAVLTAIWNGIVSVATTVFTAIATFFSNLWTGIQTVAMNVWNFIVSAVTAYWNAWVTAGTAIFNALASFFSGLWNGIKSVASSVWNAISSAVAAVWNGIKSNATSVFNALASFFSSMWNGIKSVVSSVWNAIQSAISSAINAVRSVITSVLSFVQSYWSSSWNTLRSVVSSVWSAIQSAVSGAVSAVQNTIGQIASAISGVRDRVMGAIGNAGSWLVDSGRKIIQGLIDGITGMIGRAKDAIGNVMGSIRAFLPFSPAKEGPFSGKGWTPYSGRALTEGLADGIESRVSRVKKAALAMTRAAQVGDLSLGFDDGDYGVDMSGTNIDRSPVIVQGNVGYNPQQIADAIHIKKRQAALVAGMDMVQVR